MALTPDEARELADLERGLFAPGPAGDADGWARFEELRARRMGEAVGVLGTPDGARFESSRNAVAGVNAVVAQAPGGHVVVEDPPASPEIVNLETPADGSESHTHPIWRLMTSLRLRARVTAVALGAVVALAVVGGSSALLQPRPFEVATMSDVDPDEFSLLVIGHPAITEIAGRFTVLDDIDAFVVEYGDTSLTRNRE